MSTPLTRIALAESNEQMVFKAIKDSKGKVTVSELSAIIPHITDRTVRRCIYDLEKKGFIRSVAKRGNAMTYELADKSMYEDSDSFDEVPIIPFGGDMKTVNDFLEIVVSPDSNPLNNDPDKNLLRTSISNGIRRAMAGVVLTSGVAGQEEFVAGAQKELLKVEAELRYVLKIVSDFNNSTVWFDQYRDRIAFQNRRAQQSNPTLFQLAFDYIRSE